MDEATFKPIGHGERMGLAMLLRWFAATLAANPDCTLLTFSICRYGVDTGGVHAAMWLPTEDDPALKLARAIGSPALDAAIERAEQSEQETIAEYESVLREHGYDPDVGGAAVDWLRNTLEGLRAAKESAKPPRRLRGEG